MYIYRGKSQFRKQWCTCSGGPKLNGHIYPFLVAICPPRKTDRNKPRWPQQKCWVLRREFSQHVQTWFLYKFKYNNIYMAIYIHNRSYKKERVTILYSILFTVVKPAFLKSVQDFGWNMGSLAARSARWNHGAQAASYRARSEALLRDLGWFWMWKTMKDDEIQNSYPPVRWHSCGMLEMPKKWIMCLWNMVIFHSNAQLPFNFQEKKLNWFPIGPCSQVKAQVRKRDSEAWTIGRCCLQCARWDTLGFSHGHFNICFVIVNVSFFAQTYSYVFMFIGGWQWHEKTH